MFRRRERRPTVVCLWCAWYGKLVRVTNRAINLKYHSLPFRPVMFTNTRDFIYISRLRNGSYCYNESLLLLCQNSWIGIVGKQRLTRPKNRVLFSGRSERFFCSPLSTDCGPRRASYSMVPGALFPTQIVRSLKLTTCTHLLQRWRIRGAVCSLLRIASWLGT